ncbi:MAG: DNA repair exonuclease, partial [Eubacteriales bacterium]
LEEKDINLVMLHGQVTQYQSTGAEVIPLSCLRERYIDYLALGHIHEYVQGPLDDRGIYCYSGCLEGRGFDECGVKGFVVLDIEEEKIHTEFVSLSRRTFHEIRVDVTPYSNFAELMEEITNTLDPICADDLIKVCIVGEIEEGFELDLTYLEEFAKRRFYYAKVKNESELRIDGDQYKNDRTLKGEFIRKVQLLSVSEEEKNHIIQLGLRAIAGKEVTL